MFDRCGVVVRSVLSGAVLAGSLATAQAITLYDPALSLPSGQFWLTTGSASFGQSIAGGRYFFDTTSADAVMAGSAMAGLPFDTNAGFELDIGLRIASESHARVDRGGFSLIVTGTDPRAAIELAFWNDRVFVYTASFQHGAEALLDTTVATSYALRVGGGRYTLLADGRDVLAGTLVDYTAFGAPYTRSGLVFFGDDTSSASASVEIGRIAVTGPVPEPATGALMAAGLLAGALVAGRRRRWAARAPG